MADSVDLVIAAYPVIHQACRQREVSAPGRGPTISPHQATVLAHLDRRDGITITELAAVMEVALPTMSLMVTRLEADGLVRRERDSADRRRTVVRLTVTGERLRLAASLLDPDRVRALLDSMTPEERSAGVAGVLALARAARARAQPNTASSTRSRSP
ncbi:MAG: MarR family winged helix-turn-helix transcriptional regulator [Gemmatimonadales bacterium]